MANIALFTLIFAPCLTVQGQMCSRFSFPPDHINSALTKNVINVLLSSKDLISCADSCMYVTECLSINYDTHHNVCEWLGVHKDPARMVHDLKGYVFMDMQDWKQVRKTSLCSDIPCTAEEHCVSDKKIQRCIKFDDLCNGLYFTSLDSDELLEVVVTNVSSVKIGSEISHLFLYSHGGFTFEKWYYQFIEVNISRGPFIVKGIITKGNPELRARIISYRIATSDDCDTFGYIYDEGGKAPKNFTGNAQNDDFNTPVITYLDEPITGGCVRVYMRDHTYTMSLRMDLVGCFMK